MTMKKPEMEVVRFNESDVIVASGPVPVLHTTVVRGFNNEIPHDGEVSFQGITYKDAGALNSALSENGLSGTFQGWMPGKTIKVTYTSEDMFFFDYNADQDYFDDDGNKIETSILLPDGIYAWNGSRFTHQ